MKKKTLSIIVLVCALLVVCSWVAYKNVYSEKWIIGKTEEQIERRYGEFEWYTDFVVVEEDGNILQQSDYGYGYFIRKLGNVEYYYMIHFNCEGIAVRVNAKHAVF